MVTIKVNSRLALKNIRDTYKATTIEAKLQYVSDSKPGITRKLLRGNFQYYHINRRITDDTVLTRIRKLVIPPAWQNVWICPNANGHIQATGIDARGRKQYKYHFQWNAHRNETKFHRLLEFGKALPSLRKKIQTDICNHELNKDKVLAAVVSVMERTFIRVGNGEYEKLYGSYGLTTLKDGHVKINGAEVKFSFKGKKGIAHVITLKNKRLAKIVKACRDIPGKELFQYYTSDGSALTIDSGMVNSYIQEATSKDFSAKDFRTWAGSLSMLTSLKSQEKPSTESEIKKNIVAALDCVSDKLGNTRAVCKSYYVHPKIIELYQKNDLQAYLKKLDDSENCDGNADLTHDEKVLMKLLKKF